MSLDKPVTDPDRTMARLLTGLRRTGLSLGNIHETLTDAEDFEE